MRGWPVTLTEPHLLGAPVELRPVRMGDARTWREIRVRNASWLRPWEPTNPETPLYRSSLGPYIAMVRAMRREARQGQAVPWVVTYGGVFVGQLTVGSITWGSARSGQVGYWIDEAYAGRGIIPTTLAMAVDHCFGVIGLHRLEASIRPENHASRRVVEKLGFREEGIRVRQLHINGSWRDHVCYALTAEEVPQGLMPRWRSIMLASRSNAGLFAGYSPFVSGLCFECGDTPGRLLVSRGFSYYVASREDALVGSSMPAFAPASALGGDRLSSAILYAAIIAIWAGVLIPRWLKRDSSASAVSPDASDVPVVPDVPGASASASASASGERPVAGAPAEVVEEPPAGRRPPGRGGDARRPADSGGQNGTPRDPDPGHRRVLAARRRLLGLLVLLAATAGGLAGMRMAAWWVVVPPSVMLLGYLPLLRAASKVDAERRELAARYQMASDRQADYSRSRSGSGSRDVGETVAHVTPVRLAVPAEVVDAMAEDEIYDQYTDAKLRAVGD